MPKGKKKQIGKITVTWEKSTIGYDKTQKATIKALGLHKLHQSKEVDNTPVMRGMINKVKHLVNVKES